jgi:predicted O-methyltransferase YrrM
MSNLLDLCQTWKYHTDKWFDDFKRHSYVENFYDLAFEPYRTTATEILEVGIYEGESLRLWHDYFTNANITGVDIMPVPMNENLKGLPRVREVRQNAYDPAIARLLADRTYDVMIDDGPHDIHSQHTFIQLYLPLLRTGGLMVIEDISGDLESIIFLNRAIPADARVVTGYVNMVKVDNWERNDSLLFWVKKAK